MYYEINVALNGQHFFATDKRSITNKATMEKVYKILKEKFPLTEGYEILVTYYETVGKFVDTNYLNEDNTDNN